MEFSNREHVAKVWRSAVGNGELVDGDTMILQIVDLVEAWFVGGFHYLFFPDTLNGFGIWVVRVVLKVEEHPSVSLDEFLVLKCC